MATGDMSEIIRLHRKQCIEVDAPTALIAVVRPVLLLRRRTHERLQRMERKNAKCYVASA
jgi:hypothetical protein